MIIYNIGGTLGHVAQNIPSPYSARPRDSFLFLASSYRKRGPSRICYPTIFLQVQFCKSPSVPRLYLWIIRYIVLFFSIFFVIFMFLCFLTLLCYTLCVRNTRLGINIFFYKSMVSDRETWRVLNRRVLWEIWMKLIRVYAKKRMFSLLLVSRNVEICTLGK